MFKYSDYVCISFITVTSFSKIISRLLTHPPTETRESIPTLGVFSFPIKPFLSVFSTPQISLWNSPRRGPYSSQTGEIVETEWREDKKNGRSIWKRRKKRGGGRGEGEKRAEDFLSVVAAVALDFQSRIKSWKKNKGIFSLSFDLDSIWPPKLEALAVLSSEPRKG